MNRFLLTVRKIVTLVDGFVLFFYLSCITVGSSVVRRVGRCTHGQSCSPPFSFVYQYQLVQEPLLVPVIVRGSARNVFLSYQPIIFVVSPNFFLFFSPPVCIASVCYPWRATAAGYARFAFVGL